MWLISPLLTSLILFCGNPSPLHGNQLSSILPPSPFSPNIVFLFFSGLDFSSNLPSLFLSLTHSIPPPPPQPILLSLRLSPRLKTSQFSCHKLCSPAQLSKQGGCPFHSTSHTTKGDGREEGFNARVWTQAIISNYCFSFQFSCRDGGLTRRTRGNPLQSSRISGP